MAVKQNKNILIIGAGISGLMAANQLNRHGFNVTVLEKSRSVGGRMATRRFDGGVFDHGAQFFTVRSEQFNVFVKQWLDEKIIKEWCRGFPPKTKDGHPRFIGINGMTSVAKYLADKIDIRFSERALFLDYQDQQWSLQTENENIYTADALILTAPVPQSVDILRNGRNQIDTDIIAELGDITYEPCLGLLLTSDDPPFFESPGALQLSGEPIAWISDNSIKGISNERTAITVHAGPEFSRKYWDLDDKTLVSTLFHTVSDWIPIAYNEYQIKRWLYSHPRVVFEERTLFVADPAPIAFAGDAFGGPRVEGAALSGLAAADTIVNHYG